MAETIAEQTYIEITALTGGGMKLADAVRKIAADTGKKEGAVRASYYNYARKLTGTQHTRTRRTARVALSTEDALSGARDLLQKALESIDSEVEAATEELTAAQARYDELKAGAETRKELLEKKIQALKD